MSDRYDLDKLAAKQAATYREGARTQAPSNIGKAVLDLIRQEGDVSSARLIEDFEKRLADLPPRRPVFDIERMFLEEGLAALIAARDGT